MNVFVSVCMMVQAIINSNHSCLGVDDYENPVLSLSDEPWKYQVFIFEYVTLEQKINVEIE
jgi:hypothetical protein